jgi:hypothetical protein
VLPPPPTSATPAALVGRRVVREFSGVDYGGIVASTRNTAAFGRLWRVRYDDGDSEDLEWRELRGLLQPEAAGVGAQASAPARPQRPSSAAAAQPHHAFAPRPSRSHEAAAPLVVPRKRVREAASAAPAEAPKLKSAKTVLALAQQAAAQAPAERDPPKLQSRKTPREAGGGAHASAAPDVAAPARAEDDAVVATLMAPGFDYSDALPADGTADDGAAASAPTTTAHAPPAVPQQSDALTTPASADAASAVPAAAPGRGGDATFAVKVEAEAAVDAPAAPAAPADLMPQASAEDDTAAVAAFLRAIRPPLLQLNTVLAALPGSGVSMARLTCVFAPGASVLYSKQLLYSAAAALGITLQSDLIALASALLALPARTGAA